MIRMYEDNGKKFWEVNVSVRDKDRRQFSRKRKGITSERKARDVEFEFKTELQRLLDSQCTYTWKSWFNECMRRMTLTSKRATVLNYETRISRWVPKEWDSKFLGEISTEEVHRVIYEHIGEKLTGTGKETLWKMIRRIFEMACDEGLIQRNPANAFKVRRDVQEQAVLTVVEAQRLLDEARALNHRFWSVWTFALMSGMRSGEMYAIRWTDVDFNAGTVSITKQWTNKDGICGPKAGSSRIVPISEDFKKFLIEWRRTSQGFRKELWDSRVKAMTAHEDYILPLEAEWTNGMQADVLRDFCRQIGITPIRFHDLRATFITNLLAQGVQLAKVMMMVGHRKLGTTDQYLRKAGVPVQGATEALGYKVPEAIPAANVLVFQPKSGG